MMTIKVKHKVGDKAKLVKIFSIFLIIKINNKNKSIKKIIILFFLQTKMELTSILIVKK